MVKLFSTTSGGAFLVKDLSGSTQCLFLNPATNALIDARSNVSAPVTTDNVEYAVRSVAAKVTTIPAGTTAYSLTDVTATTNNHSFTYIHAPTSQPTYTLPVVSDATVAHEISLKVYFSASMTSAPVFYDSDGTTIISSKGAYSIVSTSIIEYLCEWDSVAGWCIYALEVA